MLEYFIIFTIVGFALSYILEENKAILLIIVIAIVWGFSTAIIWGFVSLGEMFLGYFVSRKLINKH